MASEKPKSAYTDDDRAFVRNAINSVVNLIGPINTLDVLARAVQEQAVQAEKINDPNSASSYFLIAATLAGIASGLNRIIKWTDDPNEGGRLIRVERK